VYSEMFIEIILLLSVYMKGIWRQNPHSNATWNGLWIQSYCCKTN